MKKKVVATIICILIFVGVAFGIPAIIGVMAMKGLGEMGTSQYDAMPSSDEVIQLQYYSGEAGELLGHDPEQYLNKVFELEGMETEDYLCTISSYYYTGAVTPKFIMRRTAAEPIERYPISQIVIYRAGGEKTTINDKKILNKIQEMRKTNTYEVYDHVHADEVNARVYFDLPCKLVWSCRILKTDDNRVYLFCYDEKLEQWHKYDVTRILRGVL